jgi:peroxiredoxin
MSLEMGATAPLFTLPDTDRKPVSLQALLDGGPVVLLFFPAAFSPTCTKEMCTFRDSAAELNALSATVVAISVDTVFALKAWREAQGFTFSLLSDFNKEVIRAYDVVLDDLSGMRELARRAVFVIDSQGIVRYRQVLENPRELPDYLRLKDALAGLPAS